MAAPPVSAIIRLTLLASVHGFSVNTAGHLSTCSYPSICQDNCAEGFMEPRCRNATTECPCIIQACWALNGSCIHACSETSIVACLECLDSAPETVCDVECSRVCLDAGCEHSQGECHGCVPGAYGQSCGRSCSSVCNGACYKDTGYCKLCQHRRHGVKCEHTCADNCHACSSQNGTCLRCAKGYTGKHCSRPCADGLYGFQCQTRCSRNCAGTCDRVSGSCVGGCKPGYFRPDCGHICPLGKFGQDCASECAVTCVENMVCHHINGSCTHGCSSGFRGDQCGLPCPLGKYGENCGKNCSQNCVFGLCNRFSGHCQRCDVGRVGVFCEYITHVRRTRTNIDDGTMTTDQTILIFLGLFAMGGGMWFLLATFAYYKQKIIMKKVQQTGQLPRNWTTIVRRYPQYFYSPRFLSRAADVETFASPQRVGSLQSRERTQLGGRDNSLGDEFPRQVRQEFRHKVQMQGQQKSVLRQKLRENIEMEALRRNLKNAGQGKNVHGESQGKNVHVDGQRNTFTIESIEASLNSEKHISEDKTDSLAKTYSIVNTNRWCHGQGYSPDHLPDRTPNAEVYLLTKRGQNYEKLATMFEVEEDLIREKTAKGVRHGTENVKAEPMNSRRDLHVISRPATALGSRTDAAGDTKFSTVFDMSISATTGLETKSAQLPQRRPADMIAEEVVPDQMLQQGVHLRSGADNKKRTPQKERKFVVDEARTSAPSTACAESSRQCACSVKCQCSADTIASTQQDELPGLLELAKSSSRNEHLDQPFLLERVPSPTSNSYSNMKLAAPATHSPNERVLLQSGGPEARIDSPGDQRLDKSNQIPTISLDAPTAVASTGGDTETELSASRASSSDSSTLQTPGVKAGSSYTTASEDETSEATSTTIASTVITDASDASVVIKRTSITESLHRYFLAAMERQSQHYVAKTDLWQRVDEQNAPLGAHPNQQQWSHAQRSQYESKPRGFFKRNFRNVVGAFGKLMGMDPGMRQQGVVGISSRAAESAETRPSGDLLMHRLDSWRQERQAATEAAAPITQMTSRRQRWAPFRPPTFALMKRSSSDETLTERSSAMSSTAWTSSRTNKGDSTLTDASDIDNSTGASSEEEPGTSTTSNSQASSTAATPSGDMSEASTQHQTSTEAESLAALTKSDSPSSSRHHRSHRRRHHH